MFTGIIEATGIILALKQDASNLHITIQSPISHALKIDQSVSHNGVCLTVVKCDNLSHTVTAIDETIHKTNISKWKIGDTINLERCLKIGDRLDGHMVQGHVDTTAALQNIEDASGSFLLTFAYPHAYSKYIVEKGSICINGISLTVVFVNDSEFSVAIIPYTWEHTNLSILKPGDLVNIEFDIIGKYVEKMMGGVKK